MFTEYAFRVERASNRYLPKGSVWSLNYQSAPTVGAELGSYNITYKAVTPVGTILHEVEGYTGTPEEVASQKAMYDAIMDCLRSVQKLQKAGLSATTLLAELKNQITKNGLEKVFTLNESATGVEFNKFTPKRNTDAVTPAAEPAVQDTTKEPEVNAGSVETPEPPAAQEEPAVENTKVSKARQKA